jgi:hypothetical protein
MDWRQVVFTIEFTKTFDEWRRKFDSTRQVKNQSKVCISTRSKFLEESADANTVKDELTKAYEAGYGFKSIGSQLGISYTRLRTVFDWLGIERRHGQNVVTDKLRETRRLNVLGEKSPWHDWPNRKPEMFANKGTTGVQGRFRSKSGETFWLRSTWEYIYAKWLDDHGIEWKTEVQCFDTPDGKYRPDFFLYEDGKLTAIVEVKGLYERENQRYKDFVPPNGVTFEIIRDISPFLKDTTYAKELACWKMEKSFVAAS